MPSRLLIGAAAGGVADVALTNVLCIPIVIYVMLSSGIANLPKAEQSAATMALLHASPGLYVVTFCIATACAAIGGYVAAWIARERELLAGALSSIPCLALGLYALASGKATDPLWVTALAFVASPAIGAAGGYVRRMQRG